MTPPLFLVPDLGTGAVIALTGPEAHHAGTVKRLRVGEPALLADGRGGLAEAVVESVGKDQVSFTVLARRQVRRPVPRFVVVQALPKGERADLAVEVLTELGADEIVPWSAARSISSWKDDRAGRGLAKWQRTATAAAKQSRRAWIPAVAELASTDAVLKRVGDAWLAVVLDAEAELPLAELAAGLQPPDEPAELLLIVGPEGGIDAAELSKFAAAGARAARLGPEVLRTSTAGAAALAVLSVATGRWR